ncbi:sialidase-4 [Huso huso]|uniref:exo-alpha-sialidase n=1 Tax=Huso huso TaxID=61971 RepID=A0ABR0ZGV1_HUSHU
MERGCGMGPQYFPGRTVLFRREANGVTFRIPALLYIPSSTTFLAFSEERLSPNDAEANLLVLRRGTFYRNYVEWEDMRALYPAYLKNHRSMNPCPVFDEFTGTVFLFFIAVLGNIPESFQLITGKNVTRLCYISSTDHGRTWSPVTDLTDRTIRDSIKEWATFALGPGHGIQLKSGRLLIPAYAYHIDCKECFGKICTTTPHSFTFYSDNHGKSWRFGEFVPNLETVECQLVSVDEEDGTNTLYCNSRSPLGYRVQALSKDDGAVFLEGQLVQKLVEQPHGCHGSVVGFPAPVLECGDTQTADPPNGPVRSLSAIHGCRPSQNGTPPLPGTNFLPPTWVIYSHPSDPNARVQLGIYLSTFPRDPDSWSEPWVIYEGPSAYSDLAYVELPSTEATHNDPPAVAFACLFENGSKSPYEEISFSIFTLYELINNIPKKSDLSHRALKRTKLRNYCVVA